MVLDLYIQQLKGETLVFLQELLTGIVEGRIVTLASAPGAPEEARVFASGAPAEGLRSPPLQLRPSSRAQGSWHARRGLLAPKVPKPSHGLRS